MEEFKQPSENSPDEEPKISEQSPRPLNSTTPRDLIRRFAAFSRTKGVRETIITVLIAVVLFVGIRSMANASEVNGNSMLPNLHDGERVIVSKMAYWLGNPHRGDIVVFNTDRHDYDIIHRIVGLPGERVEIRNGVVFVNGQALEEPYTRGNHVSEPVHFLGEDEYLIVGDNRDVSAVDVVSKGDIIGKAWITYWPLDDWGRAPNYSSYSKEPQPTP